MGVPPPFLFLFGIKHVGIINILAVKNLRTYINSVVCEYSSKVWCLDSENLGD